MLTPKGKLYGDLTVACLGEDHFMLFGSGAAQEMHRRWFEGLLQDWEGDVQYANVSGRYHGIGLSGPNSRKLLQRICRDDVSSDGMKFRDVRQTFVGGVPAILVRISFSGEMGCEIYVAPKSRRDRGESLGGARNHHIVLLAENTTGYRNLLKLLTLANFEGFYYKPRVDKELLTAYHEGLIGLSSCLHGEVASHLLAAS